MGDGRGNVPSERPRESTFHVLIDTCVWLDIAQNQKLTPLLTVLVEFIDEGHIRLLLPRTVVDEFQRNRERVAKTSAKSLATHFNAVKDAIRKAERNKRKRDRALDFLSDVDHRIPMIGGEAKITLDRIDELFAKAAVIETSDAIKARATDRALTNSAPCHQNKNSMADAVLIETYFECVKTMSGPGHRFAFITHNKTDFSLANGNQKLPHTDIAAGFSKIKSMYFIALVDCLRRVDSMRVSHLLWESEWDQPARGLTDILKWMDRLTTQVWHKRHMNWVWRLERGKDKIVSRAEWDAGFAKNSKYSQTHTSEEVWIAAKKAAREAERMLGKGNHGPYTDFEWGMINGKLSALRWVLGEEWDMLDT